jgi:hypothetical protein
MSIIMNQEMIDGMKANVTALRNNGYPGRGIILGLTPDGQNYVQIYWIMGRSENSRNRIFVNENGFIKTKAYDEAKVTDPSLIIYYPGKFTGGSHIITNGDQTDTIFNTLNSGGTFESALNTRQFEPDAPNFTPRISGIVNRKSTSNQYEYQLSILKGVKDYPDICIRHYFNYETAIPGVGHCLHTYIGDGNPLPSFTGEPYILELQNDINQLASFYWDVLNQENRISLLVKFINITSGASEIKIINKLG